MISVFSLRRNTSPIATVRLIDLFLIVFGQQQVYDADEQDIIRLFINTQSFYVAQFMIQPEPCFQTQLFTAKKKSANKPTVDTSYII